MELVLIAPSHAPDLEIRNFVIRPQRTPTWPSSFSQELPEFLLNFNWSKMVMIPNDEQQGFFFFYFCKTLRRTESICLMTGPWPLQFGMAKVPKKI